MTTYISLLRGINVGREKKISMSDLRSLYTDIGFNNVKTYVNSGNVIFDSDLIKNSSLTALLEKKIKATFGFNVPVIIRNAAEMETVAQNNPFIQDHKIGIEKLYVTFLSEKPADKQILDISKISSEPDKFIIRDREVYLHIPGFYSKTKFSNEFFEKQLKVKATTRHWKTVLALIDLTKNS